MPPSRSSQMKQKPDDGFESGGLQLHLLCSSRCNRALHGIIRYDNAETHRRDKGKCRHRREKITQVPASVRRHIWVYDMGQGFVLIFVLGVRFTKQQDCPTHRRQGLCNQVSNLGGDNSPEMPYR